MRKTKTYQSTADSISQASSSGATTILTGHHGGFLDESECSDATFRADAKKTKSASRYAVTPSSMKPAGPSISNGGNHRHFCRAFLLVLLLTMVLGAVKVQYNNILSHRQQSEADIIAKIYNVDSNQRVFVKGGSGADGGAKRKGDYYYPKKELVELRKSMAAEAAKKSSNSSMDDSLSPSLGRTTSLRTP